MLFKQLLLMTAGGVFVIVLLAMLGIWHAGNRFFTGLNMMLNAPPPEPQVDVRSLVIHKIRGASELTTAIFTMEVVVPSSRDRVIGEFIIGKTTLLYIAHGEVRAGIDLQELAEEDITLKNNILRVRLPAPRLLDSKIDVHRSSVYDYDRGFLGLGPDVAPQLQDLSQEKALEKIIAAACAEGLLGEANSRAELVVRQLVQNAGYDTIEVETQLPTTETCTADILTTTAREEQVPPSPTATPSPKTGVPSSPPTTPNIAEETVPSPVPPSQSQSSLHPTSHAQ